ncbi:hypothetical protein [Massilia aquatica]|uniref:Uncharacterized protein n=1 Tax=Massilia aquatica TaxID=2609000 RepID=A0ABX0MG24_9BURK|nr:hypothetical protein [Massilia aquatica]NHZ43870.1 hypothetical protein [Massilia aquatica]
MAKSRMMRHAEGAVVSAFFLSSLLLVGVLVGEDALIVLYFLWPTVLIAAALVWYLTLSPMPLASKILRLALYLLLCAVTVVAAFFNMAKDLHLTLQAAAYPVLGMLIFAAIFPAPKKVN